MRFFIVKRHNCKPSKRAIGPRHKQSGLYQLSGISNNGHGIYVVTIQLIDAPFWAAVWCLLLLIRAAAVFADLHATIGGGEIARFCFGGVKLVASLCLKQRGRRRWQMALAARGGWRRRGAGGPLPLWCCEVAVGERGLKGIFSVGSGSGALQRSGFTCAYQRLGFTQCSYATSGKNIKCNWRNLSLSLCVPDVYM